VCVVCKKSKGRQKGRGACVTPALLITEKGSMQTAQKVDTNACQER
jgi:hypothetical protein